jgi:hypothetical protein
MRVRRIFHHAQALYVRNYQQHYSSSAPSSTVSPSGLPVTSTVLYQPTSTPFFTSSFSCFPAAQLFSTYVLQKLGCNGPDVDVLKCVRSKKVDDFFLTKDDWPANSTIPPLAPAMPWGYVATGLWLRQYRSSPNLSHTSPSTFC